MANDLVYNSAKRLPIVFCLDVSPSMGSMTKDNKTTSIDLLNAAVENFINELKKDPSTKKAAEISFVTFSTNIEMNTNFANVGDMAIPKLTTVDKGSTHMSKAVICSIEKIENRRKELEDKEIPYYAPFLVLVTDGNPDDKDKGKEQAIEMVKEHCDSHVGAKEIIIPFIIGVGDYINPETLERYSAGFTKGYFPIKTDTPAARMNFTKVFQLIGNSTKKSIHLNDIRETVTTVQRSMNDLLDELGGI